MTAHNDFDARMREIGQRAIREMAITAHVNAPPWEPATARRRRFRFRFGSPLAAAVGIAAAIAVAAPLLFGPALHGGTAGQHQPPEVNKDGATILRDATDAMSHARSYHLVEHGTASDGSAVTIDLRLDRAGSAVESWTMGGHTDTVLVWHGDLFVKGPDAVPSDVRAVVGDRWYGVRGGAYADSIIATVSPARISSCLVGDPGTLTKDGEHTVNGARAVRLVSTATTAGTVPYTLDVAIDSTPYPLHMETDAGPSSRADCQGPASPLGNAATTPQSTSTGHQVIEFDGFDSADLIARPTDYVDAFAVATATP
ncbi:MAG TPA: hypothetical protein VN193_15295 [Candidatus Angelobacter sp.]|jgi:hypothetical protein|nr:hypothetical protein [Candidatus Angelobacter sp.]